jgi:hypothetical protein
MYAEERQQDIVRRARALGGVDVAALATRDSVLIDEKERIAKAALAELPADGAVILDAGTTTARLAAALPPDRELTVVVNSPVLATTLGTRSNLNVLLLGGRVRGKTLAAVDDWALRPLADLYVDVAFLGTNGCSVERGLTTPDPAEAAAVPPADRGRRRRCRRRCPAGRGHQRSPAACRGRGRRRPGQAEREELAEAVGERLDTLADVVAAAHRLREWGAGAVLASLGAAGAVLVDQAGMVAGDCPVARPRSSVGAGDALLAGSSRPTPRVPPGPARSPRAWPGAPRRSACRAAGCPARPTCSATTYACIPGRTASGRC